MLNFVLLLNLQAIEAVFYSRRRKHFKSKITATVKLQIDL